MENYKLFIDELLHELSYRTSTGIVNLKDTNQISLLSEILTEWGLTDIKDELIGNLLGEADDKKFKNPVLNKVVSYKNEKGEDKEGIVGNLLRLAADSPGRVAAEKVLPKEGTTERDKINNELGGEGQPGRDIEKEKEKKDSEEQPQSEPQKATAFKGKAGKAYTDNLSPEDDAYTGETPDDDSTEIESEIDRKNFSEKSKNYKDAPNGPTQEEMVNDLNSGNLDVVTKYQNEVEKNRAKGVAGAGGGPASEGEAKYCNACNMNKQQWSDNNKLEIDKTKEELRNKKRTAEEERIAAALGYKSDDEEFLTKLAEAELYAKQKTAEVAADKKSILYIKGKKGFADASPNAEAAYSDWMKAAYFGSIATEKRLDESKIDTAKPHKVVQSTSELDDAVQAHLEDMYKKAETPEDKAYYKKQLKNFKKFRKYHDTFAIGKDKNGRTAIMSISNKKDSQAKDPQNNTTPAQRLRFIRGVFGEKISKNVADVIDKGVDKVSNAQAQTVRSQTKMKIDDDVIRVCEEPRMSSYMGDLDSKATDGKHRFSKFIQSSGKDWNSLSTKEKLELMQEYSNSRLYDENGNSRIISKTYIDDDGEAVDGTFYIDDDGNEVGPIKSLGAAQIGLPFEPFGKIAIKLGEFGANEETKGIKKTEKELVTEVHSEVTNALFDEDSEEGGYHPEHRPDADNGKNTQAYILGTMKAMHIDTYIDMDDDDDDAMLLQMGVNGVKPSMVRECTAERSGFTGDSSTPEGKKALKEFILKRCRVTPGGENVSIMDNGKEVQLFTDQWRTAGTSQKVASYFGKDMQECLQEKAKLSN